jgi:hypothetical protein
MKVAVLSLSAIISAPSGASRSERVMEIGRSSPASVWRRDYSCSIWGGDA